MITFARNNVKFSLRVVGIAIHDGHVLLHRRCQSGVENVRVGRADLRAPAIESWERERKEEMNARVTVVRLLWVLENFFQYKQPCHELGLYFLIDLEPGFAHYDKTQPFYGHEDGADGNANLKLIFRWFPIDGLEDVYLFPTFLRTALEHPPEHTQHRVHYDVDNGGKQ